MKTMMTTDKYKVAFNTIEWSMFFSDDLDHTAEAITEFINFTLSSNSTCKEFYFNKKHRPWITPELKELLKEKKPGVEL